MARKRSTSSNLTRSTKLNPIRHRLKKILARFHFVEEVTCTLLDDKVDEDGVWSDRPLWYDFRHRAAVLGLTWLRVETNYCRTYAERRIGTKRISTR
jgi:hypothetical protein